MKVKVIRENWMNWATLVCRVNSTYVFKTYICKRKLFTYTKKSIYIYHLYHLGYIYENLHS